jgi:LysM repeat protein
MDVSTVSRSSSLGLILLFTTPLLVGCAEPEFQQFQTLIAPAAQTVEAEGEKIVSTEVAQLVATTAVVAGTASARLVATSIAAASTEGARLLTPDPPLIPAPPEYNDIVTYIVEKGDSLSKIAYLFSTTTANLVALNENRYPSLAENQDQLEVGWVLIVAANLPGTPTPAPSPWPTAWSTTPDCDVSEVYWLEAPITCEEYSVELVTKVGLSIGCVRLDDNPLGYYKVITRYEGWVFTKNGGVVGYRWLVDKETNEVVIGPAIIMDTYSFPVCGIPRNP